MHTLSLKLRSFPALEPLEPLLTAVIRNMEKTFGWGSAAAGPAGAVSPLGLLCLCEGLRAPVVLLVLRSRHATELPLQLPPGDRCLGRRCPRTAPHHRAARWPRQRPPANWRLPPPRPALVAAGPCTSTRPTRRSCCWWPSCWHSSCTGGRGARRALPGRAGGRALRPEGEGTSEPRRGWE
jgi:hypothetical protein